MSFSNAQCRDDLPAFSGKAAFSPAAGDLDRSMARRLRASVISSLGLQSAKKQIVALGNLPRDWDGYGSPPASSHAIAKAQTWLDHIHNELVHSQLSWNQPHVTASERGEVVLEWWREARKITVYFAEAVAPLYVKVWGPNIVHEMDDGPLEPERVLDLWAWLNR